jgi:hypothetical protein
MFDPSLDTGTFMRDFGVPVVWTDPDGNDINTLGIWEGPDRGIEVGFTVMGNEYAVTYPASDLPNVKNGDPITVDGVNYTVKDVAALDDEVFSKATLKKL